MKHGILINLFLVNENPQGLITAQISNWTGQALKFPRNQLKEAMQRPEIQRSGIYFLLGIDTDDPDQKKVYIGESEDIAQRLKNHVGGKEDKSFWEEVVLFSSKGDNLTKGQIRYLEYKLIQLTEKSPEYNLDNSNKTSKPHRKTTHRNVHDTAFSALSLVSF